MYHVHDIFLFLVPVPVGIDSGSWCTRILPRSWWTGAELDLSAMTREMDLTLLRILARENLSDLGQASWNISHSNVESRARCLGISVANPDGWLLGFRSFLRMRIQKEAGKKGTNENKVKKYGSNWKPANRTKVAENGFSASIFKVFLNFWWRMEIVFTFQCGPKILSSIKNVCGLEKQV